MKKNYMFICSLCMMLFVSLTANADNRSWDFTKWSEATINNLATEAATYGLGDQEGVTYPATTLWRSYEKKEGTGEQNGNCYWYGTADIGTATANGVEIEELKGLVFNPCTAGSLAIAVNYPSTGLGTYAGGSYLWIGGKNNVFTIPAVKCGATITMQVESHKSVDGRGVALTVNGTAVAPTQGSEKPTVLETVVWQVPFGETTTVDAVFTNNNGCHIYSIEVDENIYASVQMTWVDYDNPDVAAGAIAAGETARSGYSKISNGSVENANAGWKENKITYLQVDASAIPGNIAKATLSIDVSGSSDSKRETAWGVGYNSSVWSADLTWNTADRTITTMGATQKTATKSASTFENKTFDITEAFSNDEDKVVTLLVYETAAAGGYIKNPQVIVEYTFGAMATYTINYVDGQGNQLKEPTVAETVVGKEVTASKEQTASFKNAEGDKKYVYASGNETITIDEDETKNVINLVFREAETWNYVFNAVDGEGNLLQADIVKGSAFEGDAFNAPYPYLINVGGTIYTTTKQSSDKKGYYLSNYTLDSNNKTTGLIFTATDKTNIVFCAEAENIEGLTPVTTGNTSIRSSNGASAYAAEADVKITTLEAGKYVITTVICDASSSPSSEWTFLAGTESVFTFTATTVNWFEATSDEFTLTETTDILLAKGGDSKKAVDFIYIQKTDGTPTAITDIQNENGDNQTLFNLQGMKVQNTKGLKGLYIQNGKKVIVK